MAKNKNKTTKKEEAKVQPANKADIEKNSSVKTKPIFSKDDIAMVIAEKHGLTLKKAKEIVTDVFGTISTKTAENNKVSIHGFGAFDISERSERTGINPRTKEQIIIAAKRVPKFSAAKAFKDIVESEEK